MTQRKAFEAWWKLHNEDEYPHLSTYGISEAWSAWQAALAQKEAEIAWLIEYTLPHCPPTWAMLRRSNCFDATSDANKATRFSRREDAQAVLDQLTGMEKLPVSSENVGHYFKVTEHMWVSPTPAPAPIGEHQTCSSDEWLANAPQSVRDLANKIKQEKK